jgi:hypothetical protein
MSVEMDVDKTPPSMGTSRSATAVFLPDENFNTQTPEQTVLLAELQDTLEADKVPASFWACLQVCDIQQLRSLVMKALRNISQLMLLLFREISAKYLSDLVYFKNKFLVL